MSAFASLHSKVQRWIWEQGWDRLRPVQERAIPLLLEGRSDLIIMAPTAGGKTEAAFLPIVSRLLEIQQRAGEGFQAVYVGPLRALINDQFLRMDYLCEALGIPVTKWHGDVASSSKDRARKRASGILLITPESLEAMLIRRGGEVARLFHTVRYVVIDEMHAFLDTPRGKQLQSILHRLTLAARADPVRVGLSATLGDAEMARSFLRPDQPDRVTVLPPGPQDGDIRLQVRGYIEGAPDEAAATSAVVEAGGAGGGDVVLSSARHDMMDDLFRAHRKHHCLIFAGSRGRVEEVTAGLEERSAAMGIPGVFFAHHGNLSRELRELTEARMKEKQHPVSIVCTTTLELGIDIGSIDAVAQLGPGHTVSGMRQRLGRSGRRAGQAAVMRFYVMEEALQDGMTVGSLLRERMVMTIAMVSLMAQGWNEPPEPDRLHLSTMIQQILALIGQYGGISPRNLSIILFRGKVFTGAGGDRELFLALLRHMGQEEVGLITQAADGTLLPGPRGERLLEGWDIFSVFLPSDDFTINAVTGQVIGRLPRDNGFQKNAYLILAGRYWQIVDVYEDRKEVVVRPAPGGRAPRFRGGKKPPHERILQEMRRLYLGDEVPSWLDGPARQLLAEARQGFRELGLGETSVVEYGATDILLFPWVGPRQHEALRLALLQAGLDVTSGTLMLCVPKPQATLLREALLHMASAPPPDPLALAALMEERMVEKYDHFLSEELLDRACAHDRLDVRFLPQIAARLLGFLDAVPPGPVVEG